MSDEEVVVREIFVAAPRESVFEMFVDPELLVEWLGISADLDPRPGGRFRFEVQPGEFCSGEYVTVDPPRHVAFTWGWESAAIPVAPGGSLVEVELEARDEGTLVRLVHSGLSGDALDLHEHGWQQFLARLAAACAGDPVTRDAIDRTPDEVLTDLRKKSNP